MSNALDRMWDIAQRRNKTFKTVPRMHFPDYRTFDDVTILGGFSWVRQEKKIRYIHSRDIVEVFSEFPQMPTEVARDYLNATQSGNKCRVDKATYEQVMRKRSAPRFANPGILEGCAYVDVRRAYFSILNIIGWGVSYHPGKWIGAGFSCEDFPLPDHSVSRNSLVSSCITNQRSEWDGISNVHIRTGFNPLMNFPLWACVQDILNGIALDMVDLGARYVHTDGYIFPLDRVDSAINRIADWGLVGRVKEQGKSGAIWNSNEYKIGYHRTLTRTGRFAIHDGIDHEVNTAWLRPRIAKLAKLRERGYLPERPDNVG